jgi:hypothetical protein
MKFLAAIRRILCGQDGIKEGIDILSYSIHPNYRHEFADARLICATGPFVDARSRTSLKP